MTITDPAELKLIEKYREMIEKRSFKDGERIGRMFSVPDPFDSDQQINVSIDLNVRSVVPKMTETEVKVERGK